MFAEIRPLIERLSFIQDKTHWGYAFRYGHLEIPRADFELIAAKIWKGKSAANTLSVAGA